MADAEGGHGRWSTAITADKHSPLVTITAGLMLVAMFLFLGFRLTIRWPWQKLIGHDDLATIIGSIFACGQSIAVFIAVHHGLGRHRADLRVEQEKEARRALYASDILSVLALTGSKLAVSLLINRLSTYKRHIYAARTITGLICLWGVLSTVFTAAEIIRVLSDVRNTWIGLGAMSILLEVALFVLPIFLVWNLKMRLSAKMTVIVGFAFRLPASGLTFARVLSVVKMLSVENGADVIDVTWDYVKPTIYTTIEMHYSLMAATIPCMHLFLRQFSTGYLGTTTDQLHGTMMGSTSNQSDSYVLSSVGSRHQKNTAKKSPSNADAVSRALFQTDAAVTTISAGCHRAESVLSDGSEAIMVQQTFDVKWSDNDEPSSC